jgi:hypothetical protein
VLVVVASEAEPEVVLGDMLDTTSERQRPVTGLAPCTGLCVEGKRADAKKKKIRFSDRGGERSQVIDRTAHVDVGSRRDRGDLVKPCRVLFPRQR